jgi:hypothetical protein
LAERPDEAERRHDAGDRQQQRDPRGHERAERNPQDDERDRQRRRAGRLEVGVEDLLELVLAAAAARLLDAQVRVRLRRRVHGDDAGIDRRGHRGLSSESPGI